MMKNGAAAPALVTSAIATRYHERLRSLRTSRGRRRQYPSGFAVVLIAGTSGSAPCVAGAGSLPSAIKTKEMASETNVAAKQRAMPVDHENRRNRYAAPALPIRPSSPPSADE